MSSFLNKKLTPRISNNRERVPTPFSVANTKGFIFMDPAIVQTRAPGSMSTATYEVREIVLSAEASCDAERAVFQETRRLYWKARTKRKEKK